VRGLKRGDLVSTYGPLPSAEMCGPRPHGGVSARPTRSEIRPQLGRKQRPADDVLGLRGRGVRQRMTLEGHESRAAADRQAKGTG